nr:protein bfr2 [Quercus suber]
MESDAGTAKRVYQVINQAGQMAVAEHWSDDARLNSNCNTITKLADFDPEADHGVESGSDDGDELSDTEVAKPSRDHYVNVDKSKLRKPKEVALGPQYRGSKVRREEVDLEDEDDPFERGFDDDDDDVDSDGDEDEDEDDGLDGLVDGLEDDDEDEDQDDSGIDEDTPETELTDEDVKEGSERRSAGFTHGQDRAELRRALDAASEQKHVTSSLLQGNRQEAEKGRAMKKQRAAFDSLLNTRIKLQKALIGVNTVSGLAPSDLDERTRDATQTIEAAENAAFALWSSLDRFREDILAAKTGEKRKASKISAASSVDELWTHMQAQEKSTLESRHSILQRWSEKTRVETLRSNINTKKDSSQTTIVDNIREHLSNIDHLIRRAHTPRSCAPLQLAAKVSEDDKIYDDADFYGLLLKELLETKAQDSVAASNISNIDLSFQLRREAKTKKTVDVKASKGRKLKYTVHEKLQNYMAPEDRCSWGERQTDELFSSLFGQRMELGEDKEVGDVDEDNAMDDAAHEDAALMLFKS